MTNHERMNDSGLPFKRMLGPGFQAEIEEYINIEHPDSDAKDAHDEREMLTRLGLNESSTALDVRQRAYQLRSEIQGLLKSGGRGGYDKTAQDLYRVLHLTHDVKDFEDVLLFLASDRTIEQVVHERDLFGRFR